MYYITLYVTKGQEEAIQSLYKEKGWTYLKAAAPILSSMSPIVLPNGVGFLPNPEQKHTLMNKVTTPISTVSVTGNTCGVSQTELAKTDNVCQSLSSSNHVDQTEYQSNYVGQTKSKPGQVNQSETANIKVDLSDTSNIPIALGENEVYSDNQDEETDSYSPEMEENPPKTIIIKTEDTLQDQSFGSHQYKQKDLFKCATCHLCIKEDNDQIAHGLLDCHSLMEEAKTEYGYKCEKCESIFISSDNYIWHFLNKTCETKVCNHCGVDGVDGQVYEKHQNTTCSTILINTEMSEGKYMCSTCKTCFGKPKIYMRHNLMGFCQGYTLICDFCGKYFPTRRRANYTMHLRTHLNDRPHVCKECGKAYIEKQSLKKHMRKHTGEKPYKCRYENCTKYFPTHSHRMGHEMFKHMDIPRTIVCHICGQAFKVKSALNFHLNNAHSNVRNFACEICDWKSKTSTSLKIHMLTHKTVRDHVCEVCGKGFKSGANLKEHMIRHTDNKNHVCGTCGKAFFTRQYLKLHERIHTGDKPYHCKLCDYRCAVRGNMYKHIRGVHNKDDPTKFMEQTGAKDNE